MACDRNNNLESKFEIYFAPDPIDYSRLCLLFLPPPPPPPPLFLAEHMQPFTLKWPLPWHLTKTEVLSEQLSRGEVGQSDSDVSFPPQSKDWLYTETELWPLVTFRVSDPLLEIENTTDTADWFKIQLNSAVASPIKSKKCFFWQKCIW